MVRNDTEDKLYKEKLIKRRTQIDIDLGSLAERRGFEPPIAFTILAFQAGTLDHSDTSP